jgi:hypothetical protein
LLTDAFTRWQRAVRDARIGDGSGPGAERASGAMPAVARGCAARGRQAVVRSGARSESCRISSLVLRRAGATSSLSPSRATLLQGAVDHRLGRSHSGATSRTRQRRARSPDPRDRRASRRSRRCWPRALCRSAGSGRVPPAAYRGRPTDSGVLADPQHPTLPCTESPPAKLFSTHPTNVSTYGDYPTHSDARFCRPAKANPGGCIAAKAKLGYDGSIGSGARRHFRCLRSAAWATQPSPVRSP